MSNLDAHEPAKSLACDLEMCGHMPGISPDEDEPRHIDLPGRRPLVERSAFLQAMRERDQALQDLGTARAEINHLEDCNIKLQETVATFEAQRDAAWMQIRAWHKVYPNTFPGGPCTCPICEAAPSLSEPRSQEVQP